ncbi:VOC family protein [Antrihabitans cavernicola]|uniref:VOC family protein n=1 Tax=Antrihabitans cavernicola TaxID=2495913 RepID=A0A5A7SFH9_9NOCA|nr:VOC family protein [Spelaeibacter cavernicola]KAA0024576.1 VOC family protein [Spelaeibacter cavernicola]
MSIATVTHINLRGEARAALEFYQSVFGGNLVALTYRDANAVQNPDEADHIMWGEVTSPEGFQIMAFDVPSSREWDQGKESYFVSVRGKDADEVTRYWEGLSAQATIKQPLGPAAWGPLYGMLTDQFGVTWVLDVTAEYSPA